MDPPLSNDEKRALLAEAIKSSNVSLEALAGFVRANCPTYDLFSIQLPGRNLQQCADALEEMLKPERDYRPPPAANISAPASYSTDLLALLPSFSCEPLSAPASSSPEVLPDPHMPRKEPRLSVSHRRDTPRGLHVRSRRVRRALRSQLKEALPPELDTTRTPEPRKGTMQDDDVPKGKILRRLYVSRRSVDDHSASRSCSQTSSPKPAVIDMCARVGPHENSAGKLSEGKDQPKTLSMLQPAAQRPRDGEKQTSNPVGSSQTSPGTQMQSESNTSSSSSTGNPPMHMAGIPNSTTDDICNIILNTAFSTNLDELDAPAEAWQSVYWRLAECVVDLSDIVGYRDHHITHTAGSSGTAGSTSSVKRGASGQSMAKRKRGMMSAPGREGPAKDDDVEDGQGIDPRGKSLGKESKSCSGYTCPFRKRNPLRFNVRTHLNCATQTFSTITLLKRHVATFHKRPAQAQVTCACCGKGFATRAGLHDHLRARSSDMCRIEVGGMPQSASNPEDGISIEVENRLRDRRAKEQVLDWATLWKVLFPGDETIPGPQFNPVIEIDEVEAIFQNEFDTLPPAISTKLQIAIEASSGIPAATALAEVASHAFRGFFVEVTQHSRKARGPLNKARKLLPPSQTTVPPYLTVSDNLQGSNLLLPPASHSQPISALEAMGSTSTPTPSTSKTVSPLPAAPSGIGREGASEWHWGPFGTPLDASLCPGCFQSAGSSCACVEAFVRPLDFDALAGDTNYDAVRPIV